MTKLTIEKIRKYMIQAGVYSLEDINKICELETAYAEECEQIAEECTQEGKPSWGSDYELRCEAARKYYDEQLELIDSAYEEEEE